MIVLLRILITTAISYLSVQVGDENIITCSVLTSLPVSTSHSLITTIIIYLSVQVSEMIIITCSVLTSLPVSTSHSLAVVSMLAVPTYVLCGLNVTPTYTSTISSI